MATIRAIFENGVFRPTEPVALAESTEVTFEPRPVAAGGNGDLDDSHFISRPPRMTQEEIAQWLHDLAACSSGGSLPEDWSRADIYDEDEPR